MNHPEYHENQPIFARTDERTKYRNIKSNIRKGSPTDRLISMHNSLSGAKDGWVILIRVYIKLMLRYNLPIHNE